MDQNNFRDRQEVQAMELNLTGRPSGHGTPDDFANLSAVLIDGEQIFLDNGAIHGKSQVERGIDFRSARSPEDVPDGRVVDVIWVTLKRYESGSGYHGIASAQLFIDANKRIGYKPMGSLVNQMDRAVKGMIELSTLSPEKRQRLAAFLAQFREDLWENTPAEVKEKLA
jgi:hypothetical protein